MRGGLWFASSSLPSAPTATIVPMVSKKSASNNEKTSRSRPRSTPGPAAPLKAPNRSTLPIRLRSGTAKPPSTGTFCIQPVGLTTAPVASLEAPTWKTASTMIANTVAAPIAISNAPLTLRTNRAIRISRPIRKIAIGHPLSAPPMPSSTGVPTALRTTPASTRPMKAMNRPMPTEMAARMDRGTALKTALRKPVSTRMVIRTPSQTTRPMAWGHVIFWAMV